uniref:F-box/WD repeat-containing protein 8 n=1 Tax=Myxine glutinosa TaxID=7769 RepID=UPI00358EBC3A
MEDSLEGFRTRWKRELKRKHDVRSVLGTGQERTATQTDAREEPSPSAVGDLGQSEENEGFRPGTSASHLYYQGIQQTLPNSKRLLDSGPAKGLWLETSLNAGFDIGLKKGRRSTLAPRTLGKHNYVAKQHFQEQDLVSQLIRDIDELTPVPFFDVQLPYELALCIFSHLDVLGLGRCAQVSRSWKLLAEDNLLWFRLCLLEGYLKDCTLEDWSCWKRALCEERQRAHQLKVNWRTRTGIATKLTYDTGGVLCAAHASNGMVTAGYSTGDVAVWDTGSNLGAPHIFDANMEQNSIVNQVSVGSTVIAAAYENGTVLVWDSHKMGQPVHKIELSNPPSSVLVDGGVIAVASGCQIRAEVMTNEDQWCGTLNRSLPQPVSFVRSLGSTADTAGPILAAAAGDSVFLCCCSTTDNSGTELPLHCVYGKPVSCLEVSGGRVACGIRSSGWAEGSAVMLYCADSRRQLVRFGGAATTEYTSLGFVASTPQWIVAGSREGLVRGLDLRAHQPAFSLRGHQLAVTAVYADEDKAVSGGEEGLLVVWDLRVRAKLWESRSWHPIRLLQCTDTSILVAHVPQDKRPHGAGLSDDDLTVHRRLRGTIDRFDFSETHGQSDRVLPICCSTYEDPCGYNYNVNLVTPFDELQQSLIFF